MLDFVSILMQWLQCIIVGDGGERVFFLRKVLGIDIFLELMAINSHVIHYVLSLGACELVVCILIYTQWLLSVNQLPLKLLNIKK